MTLEAHSKTLMNTADNTAATKTNSETINSHISTQKKKKAVLNSEEVIGNTLIG